MTKLERSIQVCDFCYSHHLSYIPHLPFDFFKKRWVTTCSFCSENNVMCWDCYKYSTKELKDSTLAKFGLGICKKCIVGQRRDITIQLQLEAIIFNRIAEIQNLIRTDVYILTNSMSWPL